MQYNGRKDLIYNISKEEFWNKLNKKCADLYKEKKFNHTENIRKIESHVMIVNIKAQQCETACSPSINP